MPKAVGDLLYGDANNDKSLTAADCSQVMQKVLNGGYCMDIEDATDSYMDYVDMDKNGMLTAADAAEILNIVLNG